MTSAQHLLALLTTSIATFIIGVFVYFKNKRVRVNQIFALYSFSIATWSLGQGLHSVAPNLTVCLFWGRLSHIGVVFIPTLFLHFVFALLDIVKEKRKILVAAYFLSSFFLFFNLFTKLYIPTAVPKFSLKYYIEPGFFYPFSVAFFIVCVIYGLYKLFKEYFESTGIRHIQMRYLCWSSLFGYLGGGVNFLFVFDKMIYPLNPFGTYLVPLYVFVTVYAIVRYRFLDIKIVVTRATIFSFVYLIVLGLPFGIGYKLRGTGLWVISLVAMAIFATAGPFIYSYLQRKAESRLRREEFLAHRALNRLAQDMMRFTKLGTLLRLIVHNVVKIMKVNSASIYLRDEGNKHYQLRATWGINGTSPEQSEFSEDSPLIKDISLRRVPIVSEELKLGHTSKISPHLKRLQLELHRSKAAVIIPALKGDYLFGFLMLGARRDNRMFTQDDLNLLLLLANQSVLAIENAQLFEKEKSFLAEKSRRDALADMAPGVAHQFNNRLAAMILAAESQMALLDQEDLKKLSPKASSLIKQTKTTLNNIMKDGIRGKDIANAILKKGRAKLTYAKTDLAPIIQSAIDLLNVSRTRKSLEGTPEPEIILDIEENLPQFVLNESLIQDIFYNLIDNARDAIIIKAKSIREDKLTPDETPYKGKITITLAKKDDKVIVTVHDNGIGMEEKTKSRLFVPYFTTKATALKGTGMGLWVIRSFIEDHKGKISFESEYTKGTTFTIGFPIPEA